MGVGLDYITYMDFISNLVVEQNPSSILDVGCGDGRFLSFIYQKNEDLKRTYVGIDLCEKAILFARLLNQHENFFCNDVADIKNVFEAVALIEVMEHIPDESVSLFLTMIKNKLSPSGKLWISVPSVNIPVNEKHYRHYSTELLQKTLNDSGFDIENIYYIYKISLISKIIRKMVINRFYMLNSSILTKLIWKFHCRMTYMANENNCSHIIVKAQKI